VEGEGEALAQRDGEPLRECEGDAVPLPPPNPPPLPLGGRLAEAPPEREGVREAGAEG
jgi:hypothetical protein